MALFNVFVRSEHLNSQLRYLAPRNYRHYSMVWCETYFDILTVFRRGSLKYDGRTNQQTDRIAIATAKAAYNDACKKRKAIGVRQAVVKV